MSELANLIQLMQQQMDVREQQMDVRDQQMQAQLVLQREHMVAQMEAQQKQMNVLFAQLASSGTTPTVSIPNFEPFDQTSELWKDYLARFKTFSGANSIAQNKLAQAFLTNQTTVTYKLLSTLAVQQAPPKDINDLTMEEITAFMENQFDPRRFIVRERFKFWSEMERKPGETIQELAARIRQDASKCDFSTIQDPQDEAMRTRFICSVNNEAVLKALFKIGDDKLTFCRAIQAASETEDAATVAKETVHGSKGHSVLKLHKKVNHETKSKKQPFHRNVFPKGSCPRCGKTNHTAKECRFKDTQCHYCKKIGHLESVCLSKKKTKPTVDHILARPIRVVKLVCSRDPVWQTIQLNGKHFVFEVDTGAPDNFCSKEIWRKLGKPRLQSPHSRYIAATGKPLPVLGTFYTRANLHSPDRSGDIEINVLKNRLNLLGRTAMRQLNIDVTALLSGQQHQSTSQDNEQINVVSHDNELDLSLQNACQKLCSEFPDLMKPGLGCLQDFELEVKFKQNAQPIFCKPRTVPLALLDDINVAYEAGIKKGVWQPTQFNNYGTPVVPVKKGSGPIRKLRVCGDYSVTVNPQLETHRHPMPLPEDLMRKLSGGYYFTKIDLTDAYNQVKLAPESQKRLALSTHRGVLLQKRLPFGISSAPGYFQELMEQLTSDLKGVAVYLDDILVSGVDANEHLQNLRALFKRLQDKGMRCNLEKCSFAQPSVEYLGHTLSRHGIAKGRKVDAVLKMPPPTDVTSLRSFLGSVQFYGKFIQNLSTLTEPLNQLTRKDTPWKWRVEEQAAFQRLKNALCTDAVLAHFDPSLEIGISCDAAEVGIGAVLFHRYTDGSERPISNASKTLTNTQRRYSQIQREALAVIFALKKFHQFLYGRHFILVTDHKPLVTIFGPKKGIPAMAANRLARWALLLSQYDYSIEYRKTEKHGNADALSRLPSGTDVNFDGEEEEADIDMVCTIKDISIQLDPVNPRLLVRESSNDPVISKIMRYIKEGWPPTIDLDEVKYYKKLIDSLSTDNGCLFHGARIVIPTSLRKRVLDLIHLGHFGMQRMKQLARTAVYWPHIDDEIEQLSRTCISCGEHQNKGPKPANHPWMMPEKPWSRLHVDHAINFLGSNWLVLVDAYSKYPCIHPTSSITTKTTTELLEQDFAHFGYPHTVVTDNSTTFLSEEFQAWCRERGITHLSGAPYYPATNGAAERLVQSFKQSIRKSALPPKAALQEFLIQYRRTPWDTGYSPSELLNGRQIRSKLDTLRPFPAHVAQGNQTKKVVKLHRKKTSHSIFGSRYKVGAPCYALYCGPKRNKEPRWVPAVITKSFGTRSVNVRVIPRGPVWRRHIAQLRPRYGTEEDSDTGEVPTSLSEKTETKELRTKSEPRRNPRLPTGDKYGRDHPRRSERLQNK